MKKGKALNAIESLFLNEIVYRMPGYVFWKNRQYVYLGCNENLVKVAGLKSPDDLIGKTDYELPWSASALAFQQDDERVMSSGESKLNIEETFMHINGELSIFLTNKVPLKNEHGEVIGIIAISADISERKRMEKELSDAKEKAEAASRAKTEFIANMSHDIRTPLTGVIGLSEILENTCASLEQKENAHLLHDSGEELLNMLNDVLDDMHADHLNEHDIQEEVFDVHQCVDELIQLELPTVKLKNLRLSVTIEADVPQYVIGDRKKIHRILLNLLGNAIKFTQSGLIKVTVQCLDRSKSHIHLQFSVTDTGIGIPHGLQAKIFDRFFRASASYKGLYAGHGLGLHIAQSYASLLNGHITFNSEEGVGSTFYFDLQCAISDKVGNSGNAILATEEKPEPDVLPHGRAAHLLLVEDNPIALKVLEFLVQAAGYQFTSACSGEEALELARAMMFDLVITDIGLPGLSGTELTRFLREHHPSLPIIGLTGHARETAEPECKASGMNTVLTKPIKLETLQEMVKRYALHDSSSQPSRLGVDLPDTESALFQLDNLSLFDEQSAMQQLNDFSLLIDMLKAFISDTIQHDIQLMAEAYLKKDWESIEKTAHKIKGGVSYIGTLRLQYACQYLERYYKTGHHALLEKLYAQMVAVNLETVHTVTEWLDKHGGK